MPRTLRFRLIAPLVLALVALTAAGITWSVQMASRVEHLDRLLPVTVLINRANELAHQLQLERGRTVHLIQTSYADTARSELRDQRDRTDKALAAYRKFTRLHTDLVDRPRLQGLTTRIREKLDKVPGHRALVDKQRMVLDRSLKYYTGLIDQLLNVNEKAAMVGVRDKVTQTLVPLTMLVRAKEQAGLERATGAALLDTSSRDQPPSGLYRDYLSHLSAERTLLRRFQALASEEQKQLFGRVVSGPSIRKVHQWRQKLANLLRNPELPAVGGGTWFTRATERINRIKAVEEDLVEDARASARQILAGARFRMWLILGLSTALVGGLLAFAWASTGRVTAGLERLRDVLASIAKHEIPMTVPYTERKDELGTLARATQTFQEDVQALAHHRDHLEERVAGRTLELERTRAQREELLNSLGEGLFGLDAEENFTFLNPAAVHLLGLSGPDEVLGQTVHALIQCTDRAAHRFSPEDCPIRDVLTTGKTLQEWEGRFHRADGSHFPVRVNASPIHKGAEVRGAVVAFTDLAEREALFQRLTPREREVVQLLVQGLTNKETARRLNLSPRTVEEHRARIMEKLEVGSFAELVRLA